MLTFSKLGKKGNLGNHLFQIASLSGLASKHQQTYSFPKWEYENYFDFDFPKTINNIEYKYIKEKNYHHYEWDLKEINYDIEGWLQSEKYFDIPLIRKILSFKEHFLQGLMEQHSFLFNKKNILISIRRGDFVSHPFYYQLSYKFYFLSLIKFFPDWKDRIIIFTSDDISYCKYHFSFLPNAYFLENLSPIEQLALGSKCDDYIISNSTFSWWIAWLGENPNTKIIRPLKNFRGNFSKQHNEKDYFPERWLEYDHNFKLIPIKYFKLILKAEAFLLQKFIFNKLRGVKYRIKKQLKSYNMEFL